MATGIDVTLFAQAMRGAAEAGIGLLADRRIDGIVRTKAAGRYLRQLCEHWSGEAEVSFETHRGSVSFPDGNRVTLTADGAGLTIAAVTGPRGDPARWQKTIAARLAQFADTEELKIDWSA